MSYNATFMQQTNILKKKNRSFVIQGQWYPWQRKAMNACLNVFLYTTVGSLFQDTKVNGPSI